MIESFSNYVWSPGLGSLDEEWEETLQVKLAPDGPDHVDWWRTRENSNRFHLRSEGNVEYPCEDVFCTICGSEKFYVGWDYGSRFIKCVGCGNESVIATDIAD